MAVSEVAEYSGSGVSTWDLDLTDGAWLYWLDGDMTPSNDGVIFWWRVTTDGFSTVENTNYNWMIAYSTRGPTTPYGNTQATADTAGDFLVNAGNAAGEVVSGGLRIYDLGDATRKTDVRYRFGWLNKFGVIISNHGGGYRTSAEAGNGIRIGVSAGTFSYDFRLMSVSLS